MNLQLAAVREIVGVAAKSLMKPHAQIEGRNESMATAASVKEIGLITLQDEYDLRFDAFAIIATSL